MFNKPTFGANTSFGSFGGAATATTSPFGGFKPAAGSSAFGAPPAFGAPATAQTNTGGGLFGAANTSSGGLFGGAQASTAPAFGAASSGFGFGASTSTGGGLFGAQTSTAGTGLFGQTQNTSAFGAKPAGFGFGGTTTTGTTGLFGSTPSTGTGLFGQQTNTMGGGGLFSSTTGAFGQQQAASGTAHVKYNPVVGTDVVVKSGTSQNINIKHHCITCMKEYEGKSLEELRLEDYTAGRKGSTTGVFGGFQPAAEAKPLFGGSTFGQPAATTASGVFGGGLGTNTSFGQTNTFSFGQPAQSTTQTTGLFGAAKPAFGATATTGTGLFGAATTQASTFGTATPSFGFGNTTQNQTTGGLFGAKPATTGFGSTQPTTGFGGFGSGGGLFGAKPAQSAAPAFGTTTPAFGTLGSSGFGTATSTSGGLFGGGAFGKPATSQPAFGFGSNTTGLGANAFQAKPAGAFGGLGGGMFQNPTTNFNSGLGDSTFGGGGSMFGNTSLGGSALGMGALGANTSMTGNAQLSGASAAGNVHEQILTLVARPYGDSPLFRDLSHDTTSSQDAMKPTNPAAVKAVLDNSAYRVTVTSPTRLRVQPRPSLTHDKKSLFDGLEEADASLEDKLSLRPSRKRLVLRPRSQDEHNHTENNEQNGHRSLDERPMNGAKDAADNASLSEEENRPPKDRNSYADNNSIDASSDRHGSWLNASKYQWSAEKEKPVDNPTSRLYPNLEKDGPILERTVSDNINSERRSSWLTTKSLRPPISTNQESAEHSVRELAVQVQRDKSHDSNADPLYVSQEEEHVAPREMPPHPTGVKLTRPGYYTIPSLDDMIKYMRPDGSCVVPHLTIGRKNYGNVYYDCEMDVAGLDLDALVHFLNKEVTIYMDDSEKPPVGHGLNRRAVVTLDRIWPRDKTEKRPITDPERLLAMDYEGKLRRVCDKHDTKFIEYRPQTGSWVFRVEHFSKYSLTDSDEEDEITPEILKRQLVHQHLQTAAPPAPPKPPATVQNLSGPGLGSSFTGLGGPGLGGLGGPAGLSGPGLNMSGGVAFPGNSDLLAMHQTSINLLNGAGKAFEMDTTEDNTESQSLYQDSQRAYGVKSPTSELARLENRHSHNVQLMKASLYADAEMEDNMSLSTGDQMVPLAASIVLPSSVAAREKEMARDEDITEEPAVGLRAVTEEVVMKPLLVQPHTIVLKYHRKVPPFRRTIAGSVDAALIADMRVSRARHSRVGFGPVGGMAYCTSYGSLTHLPKEAELCDLNQYVGGRSEDDWSEMIVARLTIQPGDSDTQDTLARHLKSLLEHSTFTEDAECPRLTLKASPSDRRAALKALERNYRNTSKRHQKFGVSSSYCHEVLSLCEALWGADLENDGVPGMDELSIVNRHRRLLGWLTEAVRQTTDQELSAPAAPEPDDESDVHSSRVWTLLLGGRVLEACREAAAGGDLNMAATVAQAAGDPAFRSLVARQLSQWRECGATSLVADARLSALYLIAGLTSPRDRLMKADWLRAFHATARYLCSGVPSLEAVVRTFESLLLPAVAGASEGSEGEIGAGGPDLTVAMETDAPLPLPPYQTIYDLTLESSGSERRVLDLRYELIRARAMNCRPKLKPASYTADPMDYSLCFLLGVWFGNPTAESITGMADQLEAHGNWHLAVQALMYLPDAAMRGHLIRGVVSRHAPAKSDSAELTARLALLTELRVPQRWVLLARAHRAKYEHLPMLETEHLLGAEQWNAAHRVLLEELLPEAVLADNLQSISPWLEKLHSAAERSEVSGWENGAMAAHHYIHVCDEIRSIVKEAESTDRAAVHAKLEALRPRVAAACRAVGRLEAKTPRHAAARTEMGARLVQLALAAGEPAKHLAALLRMLRLPPDCTALAAQKIAQDLAEEASDLCIESASSSPISSHHRAAVHS